MGNAHYYLGAVQAAPGQLQTPTGLIATPLSASSASLSWNNVPSNSGYAVQISPDAGFATIMQTIQVAAGGLSATFFGLNPSTPYYLRVMAKGTGVYTDSNYSAGRMVTTLSGTALVSYMPTDDEIQDGTYKKAAAGGFYRNTLSSFRTSVPTQATTLRIIAAGTLNEISGVNVATDYIGLKVNGVYQRVEFPSNSQAQTVDVPIPAGANLEVITHDLARNGASSVNVAGTVVINVLANAVINWTAKVVPASRFLVIGDSISGGNNATESVTQGWTALTRQAWIGTSSLAVDSFSGGSLVNVYGANIPASEKSAFLARVIAQLDGTTLNTLVMAYAGTNDQGRGTATVDEYGAAYAQLLDDVFAARPATRFVCMTAFPVTSGQDGALDAYRARVRTICSSRNFIYKLLEGPALLSVSNVSGDGVHPTTDGHLEIATKFQAQFVQTTTGTLADYSLASTVFNTAGKLSGWRDNSTNSVNVIGTGDSSAPTRTTDDVLFTNNKFGNTNPIPGFVDAANNAGLTLFQVISITPGTAPTALSLAFSTAPTSSNKVALGLLNSSNGVRYGLTTYTGAVSGTVDPLNKLATAVVVSFNFRPSEPDNFQLYFNGALQADASTTTLGNSGNPVNDGHVVRGLSGNMEIGGPNGAAYWNGGQRHIRVCTLLSDSARQVMEAELRALYNI